MKTISKILVILALVATMCLCLCGCDELDEMKAQHATWTNENNRDSITYNDDQYKLIPSNLTHNLKTSPTGIKLDPVYVTEPDVPVLLSQDECTALCTNKDKTLIFGNDDDIDQTFMLYCRSDIYDEVLEKIESGIKYDGYGFSYQILDEEDGGFTEDFYTFDSYQNDVINEIESTCKKNHFDKLYEPGVYVTTLTRISDNKLFYSNYRDVYYYNETGKYYLIENNIDKGTSSVIEIPKEYNDTFDEIKELTINVDFI